MDQKLREEVVQLHAELCGGLADPNRILILYALSRCNSNVSDLARRIGLPQPRVSRHLKILRECGLVEAHRDAQSIHYRITDRRIIEALDLLRAVLASRLKDQAPLVRTVGQALSTGKEPGE